MGDTVQPHTFLSRNISQYVREHWDLSIFVVEIFEDLAKEITKAILLNTGTGN